MTNKMPERGSIREVLPARFWVPDRKRYSTRWERKHLHMIRYLGDVAIASVWWNGSEDPEIRMQVMGEWGAHGPINRGTTLFAKICWERNVPVGGVFFDGTGSEIVRDELGPRMSRGRGVYPATLDHMICAMIWADQILQHIYKWVPTTSGEKE